MLEPMDVFGELPKDIEPLPVRFKDGDGNRGLNAGCPCDETRNGPEFWDIKKLNNLWELSSLMDKRKQLVMNINSLLSLDAVSVNKILHCVFIRTNCFI